MWNSKGTRELYEMLRMLENITPVKGQEKYRDEVVRDIKKTIRGRKNGHGYEADHSIVGEGSYDGWLEKVWLPKNIQTKEDADMWFQENEYLEARPSQYDCTGQKSTCWYHIGKLNGQFVAYHRISVDV